MARNSVYRNSVDSNLKSVCAVGLGTLGEGHTSTGKHDYACQK